MDVLEHPDGNRLPRRRLQLLEHSDDRAHQVFPTDDGFTQPPTNRRSRPAIQFLCQPHRLLVHRRQLLLREFCTRITSLRVSHRIHARRPLLELCTPLSAPLRHDVSRPLLPIFLRPHLRLGTDALQFSLPRPNALFLFEGRTVDPLFTRVDHPVRVICIDLCLHLHLHRRLELRRLIDDLEAVLIDRRLIRFFECLFIDRNYLTGNVLT